MTFKYLDPAAYPDQEVLVTLYNLLLMYFYWDIAKYILGIMQQRITRFVTRRWKR